MESSKGRKPETVSGTSLRRRDRDEELRWQRRAIVAHLIGDQEHDQSELQDVLASYGIKVCPATISRDLRLLRKERWLVTRVANDCPGMDHLEAIRQTAKFYGGLPQELRKRSEGTLKSCSVFWGGPPKANGHDCWDDRLVRFAARAEPTLRGLLSGGRGIGVSFGATIGVCIEAIAKAATRTHLRPPDDLMVIPTSAEPLGSAKAIYASTDLAEQLRELLGGPEVPSLRGIAPVIPEKFEGFTHAAGFAHMRCYKSYKTIFGDSSTPGLIAKLDTVLTSAGAFGEHYHAFRNDVVENADFTRERLSEFAEGDIAGVLIGKDGLTKTQAKDLDTIRKLWTGIRIEQLRRISANARNSGHPGVILCALGANKADIVLAAAIREKLVNHLIIDETLAARLQELLNLPTLEAA
jgi:DNA-binding transcriptional regulator LsrR (DeoR family)